jgi:hypothetical protein
MQTRTIAITVALLATAVLATAAVASTKNAIQPGQTYFNTVVSGHHPTRTLVLRNGTGKTQTLGAIHIRGGHGHAFNVQGGSCIRDTGTGPPQTISQLTAGATCTIVVRVKTSVEGWWRTVLSVDHGPPAPWTAGLSAHGVVAGS